MANTVLYDAYGAELRYEKTPPPQVAEIGRVRDPWAGKAQGEATPELLARVLRGDADLSQQMMMCKRLLRDDQVSTCMRNLALSVSRLPWAVLPFDDSPEAQRQAEDPKGVKGFFDGMRFLKKLVRYLVYGEFYPFVAPELKWNAEYKLDGFTHVDPVRWKWDTQTSSLRLLTIDQPVAGIPINRRGFVIHASSLEPGTVREAGLWQKVAWLWLFKQFTWAAWVKFAEAYGNPFIWAFFDRPENKDSVLDAVVGIAANARGVFPAGTEVKLQEAQRYGTSSLYQAIKDAAEAGITKIIQGHVLATDAKSGTGTLAGNAAADVSQANLEGVAEGVAETIQSDIVAPFCSWQFGEDLVREQRIPVFTLLATPPADKTEKAKTYTLVNEALKPSGRAIDPSQIEDEFGVMTVEISAQPVGAPAAPTETKPAAAKRAFARGVGAFSRAAAEAQPPMTAEAISLLTRALVKQGLKELSAKVREQLEAAESIDEAAAVLWESYAEYDTTKLASVLKDATITAAMTGRGDVLEEQD